MVDQGASAFADLTELVERWRTLSDDESVKADRYLGDASRDIRRAYPDIDDRVGLSAYLALDVARITCNLVRRRMLSEEAEVVESDTDTQGPFTYTRRFRTLTDGLTADERRILAGTSSTSGPVAAWSNEP
jgi:hypothetical protein